MPRFFLLAITMLLLVACSKPDTMAMYHNVRSANKMVFATMAITKTAKLENSAWYGKRIAVYSYDSYMRAYIDMSLLDYDDLVFDHKNMTVKLTLPPVETEVIGRDMELRKEYENIGLLRSDLDSKERAKIKEEANKSFKAEVESNPVFREHIVGAAKRKARLYFENLFKNEGYTASVEFK